MTVTAPTVEIGYQHAPSYDWWRFSADETTVELLWPQSISVYDQMRRTDSQITSVLEAMGLLVRQTGWRIDPAGARDEVTEHVADDMALPIVGQPKRVPPRTRDRFSWPEHLRLALLMLPFGHAFFEQVYRVDPDGSRAHLRKLALRPSKTIDAIDVAPDGGLISITQQWTRSDTKPRPIPTNRLVAYVHKREGGNWLGQSILRPAYKNWLLKDRLLRVQAQTIERNGMGIPLYKSAEGATSSDQAAGLAMAKAWRAGEAAGSAVPFGADLILRGVEGTLPDAEPAVRYHDEQIGRAVLAHFLNLGTQTGSWALGTTFADFFTLSLQTLAQQIADTATQHIVEDIVDVNWGPDEPAPRLVFDEIGSRQAATAQAIKLLIDAGVIRPDEVLEGATRQQYGLPPSDPDSTRTPPGAPTAAEPATDDYYSMGDQSVAASIGPKERAASAADVDEDDDEGEDWLDAIDALAAAIAIFEGAPRPVRADAAFELKHKRGRHGKFVTMIDRIVHALTEHERSGAKADPPAALKDFDREQLRRVAVKRPGITLRRGATKDEIARALHADLKPGGGKDQVTDHRAKAAPDAAPKKVTPRAAKGITPGTRVKLKPSANSYATHGKVLSVHDNGSTVEYEIDTVDQAGYRKTEWLTADKFTRVPSDTAATPKPRKRAPAKKAAPTARPSGLPAKPESADFDDLAERIQLMKPKTEDAIVETLGDLNATELARLARKFSGGRGGGGLGGAQNKARGVVIPKDLSLEERRKWLAKLLAAPERFTWR